MINEIIQKVQRKSLTSVNRTTSPLDSFRWRSLEARLSIHPKIKEQNILKTHVAVAKTKIQSQFNHGKYPVEFPHIMRDFIAILTVP